MMQHLMAELLDNLNPELIDFIGKQKIFFVGTAAPSGQVNVSPKGMDSLRVIEPTKVVWLNYTGSGNETAAHVRALNRMTIMFCSFDKKPKILRIYGSAEVFHCGQPDYDHWLATFSEPLGVRQIFVMSVSLVQTSCGYAVPFFDYRGERDTLRKWADNKGQAGIETYWQERNQTTIDGFATGMPGPAGPRD